MPTHPPSPPPSAHAGPGLRPLAETIDDAFCDLGPTDPAFVVRVVVHPDRPGDPELGIVPLPRGCRVADALLGFTAPARYVAIGVVSPGRQHRVDRPGSPVAVRVTLLVSRQQQAVALRSALGGARPWPADRRTDSAPEGELVDACRRVLGLATPAATDPPEHWLAVRWLDALLAQAVRHPGAVRTWEPAAALHPLVPPGPVPRPGELARRTLAASALAGWEQLRRLAVTAEPDRSPVVVEPAVAAWMDAGCFARRLMAAELPSELLLAELAALVDPPLLASVREALPSSLAGRA